MIQGLPDISAQERWDLQGVEQIHQHLDPGTCSSTAELNTTIHRLEVPGTETFLYCCHLNLSNALSREGTKREFFGHVKARHFHIF